MKSTTKDLVHKDTMKDPKVIRPFTWATYKGHYERVLDWCEVTRMTKLFLYIVAIQVLYIAITTAMFLYNNPCISQDVLGWSYVPCVDEALSPM